MAAGVPVVAVDSGGPPDFIEHERTGILASSGSPDALAAALEPLLAAPALRERIGAAGRESFTHDYTDVAVRRRFFKAIEEIEQEKRRSHAGADR
jgi:glycosyltransferase involved in cell wall biosynthesis